MTTNNNRYFAIIFPSALLAVALVLILFMFSGCNAEKRAVKKDERKSNKALKHIQKAERVQPNELAKWCAKRYNPIDSVYESLDSVIYYLPSEPVFVDVDCDSVTKSRDSAHSTGKANYIKIKCPPCDSTKIISVYSKKFQQAANTAAQDSLDAYYKRILAAKDKEVARKDETISDQGKKIASLQTSLSYFIWATCVLAAYTLLRWILRIWGIKLP